MEPIIEKYKNCNIKSEFYYLNGKLHRTDGPAEISYYNYGSIQEENFWINEIRHNAKCFAINYYYSDGMQYDGKYYFKGKHIKADTFQEFKKLTKAALLI